MAQQTIQLPGGRRWNNTFDSGLKTRSWSFDGATDFTGDGPAIDSALSTPRTGVNLRRVAFNLFRGNYTTTLLFHDDDDLSDTFETNGGFDITIDGTTYRFNASPVDRDQPYNWTGNASGTQTIYNLLSNASDNKSATLLLWDTEPPSNLGNVKLGSKTPSKMYFGSNLVNRAYLGSTRVW